MSKDNDKDILFISPNLEKEEIKIHSGQSGSITPEARGEPQSYKVSSDVIKKLQQVAKLDIAHQTKLLKSMEQMLVLVQKQYESIQTFNKQCSDLSKGSDELAKHSKIFSDINKQTLTKFTKQIKTLQSEIETCNEKIEITKAQQKATLLDGALYRQLYHETSQKQQNKIETLKNGGQVLRFAMNPGQLKKMIGQKLGNSLHLAEQILFDEALSRLDEKTSASALVSKVQKKAPNNVVLVDIFARDENGKIKKTKNGEPETHTVALWKKENGKIMLIDPSNVGFSSGLISSLQFLARNRNKTASKSTNIEQLQPNVEQLDEKHQVVSVQPIKVTGKKIYNPAEFEQVKVGRLATNSRDCIDIAVKIGFVLNDFQSKGIKFSELESKMLSQITNQSALLKKKAKMSPKKIREVLSSEAFQKISEGLRSSNPQTREKTVKERDNKLLLAKAKPKKKEKKKNNTGRRL